MSSQPSTNATPPFLRLPNELLHHIVRQIDDIPTYVRFSRINSRTEAIARDIHNRKNFWASWILGGRSRRQRRNRALIDYYIRWVRIHATIPTEGYTEACSLRFVGTKDLKYWCYVEGEEMSSDTYYSWKIDHSLVYQGTSHRTIPLPSKEQWSRRDIEWAARHMERLSLEREQTPVDVTLETVVLDLEDMVFAEKLWMHCYEADTWTRCREDRYGAQRKALYEMSSNGKKDWDSDDEFEVDTGEEFEGDFRAPGLWEEVEAGLDWASEDEILDEDFESDEEYSNEENMQEQTAQVNEEALEQEAIAGDDEEATYDNNFDKYAYFHQALVREEEERNVRQQEAADGEFST
ncbi:hypothetical protein BJ508DRAFT_310202 [Ascobolus immersus RN42]|uniref:F-box domain-containing protein n=1 Tax=Ascobolus immersus RN42 TaxID=1160509 RepID=A0A3N4HUN1_ASCIM|nr:hypothetical protein BJ508DRAFT_310202 [Ascobolus immersus RN42]